MEQSDRISSLVQLRTPFERGIKSLDNRKLGIELEQQLVAFDSGEPAPLLTVQQRLLPELAERNNWSLLYDAECLAGLLRGEEKVTLEPGGAIEYSSPTCNSVEELSALISGYQDELIPIVERLGFRISSKAFLENISPEELILLNKPRYEFMFDYMPDVGTTGREMMMLTSSIQVSIDYTSEVDAMRKYSFLSKLTPFFVAISANSLGGTPPIHSQRCQRWLDTDPARCGFPALPQSGVFSFNQYIDWALDVPMYFIERHGELLALGEISFRDFIDQGVENSAYGEREYPTLSDWELHLSTLFPWVRLRNYLEVRAFDSNTPRYALAYSALLKGLMYRDSNLARLEGLLEPMDSEFLDKALRAAITRGISAEVEHYNFRDISRTLLGWATDALTDLKDADLKYLEPLHHLLED